ncbi:MAG: DegT/DnrJ/EryC1/StrS family aminotransferase [Candidatus Tritonobacter lacicola]|nr:DegT/DnrJ/EryC1/StrS family aminotransferase [Candidatus Tritonobacter lacicola]
MPIVTLDLLAQYRSLADEINTAVLGVLSSGKYIMGDKVSGLEKEIAEYIGASRAVGCASGTDALLLSLMAAGVGPGDEVITTTYTFFATAGVISRLGATPVFVDIRPLTYNIDPALMEERITGKTKAIIPVHLYGQVADMDPIMESASKHGIAVIEDACQSIGAKYKGRNACTIGHMGCLSFFPSKNLGCAGDGGMITTDDGSLADKLAILRVHGSKPKYFHKVVGINSRLDALQAAILSVKLKHLDRWIGMRRENAARYKELLAGTPVVLPHEREDCKHVFNQFVIKVDKRDELKEHLTGKGIGTALYYPLPLHLQECYAYLGYKEGDLPNSEEAAGYTLALPMYPELPEKDIVEVTDAIKDFFQGK